MAQASVDDKPYPPRTSAPRWEEADGRVRLPAGTVTLIGLGVVPEVLDTWSAEIHGSAPVPVDQWCIHLSELERWVLHYAEPEIQALVARHRMGWHVGVVGEEFAVLRVRALLMAQGMAPADMAMRVTDRTHRLIYCPHCKHTTSDAVHAHTVRCAGCGIDLEVHPHCSPTMGAYLGSDGAARDRRRVSAADTTRRQS